MFAALRFRISIPPVIRVGTLQNFVRSLFVKVKNMRSTLGTKWKWALLSLLAAAFVFAPGAAHSQSEWWRQYKAQCRAKGGTICEYFNDCKGVCTMPPPRTSPGNGGNSQGDNEAANTAAAAQRQRDAELEQQRIEDEKKRLAEELARQAKFDQGKQEALGQLKGISKSGDFDSVPGLKGVGSPDSGLKDVNNSSESLGLKILPDGNTNTPVPMVGSPSDRNAEAARILAGIRKIKVPPPVPPEDALLSFGQLVPDEKSKRIIAGAEFGVAMFEIAGTLGKANIASKVLFSSFKTLIAAENGADVYIVKQNETYEMALAYLKNAKERQKFVEIVRDVRESKPLPEDASIEMARAAQAILDPKLGNSGMHIAWDAMLSPEARHAALTQACIELAGHAVGTAAEAAVGRIVKAQQPAFQEASDFLSHARVALQQVQDPKAIEALHIAVFRANRMIAASYHVAEPVGIGAGHVGYSLFTHKAEKAAEHSFEDRKNQ